MDAYKKNYQKDTKSLKLSRRRSKLASLYQSERAQYEVKSMLTSVLGKFSARYAYFIDIASRLKLITGPILCHLSIVRIICS